MIKVNLKMVDGTFFDYKITTTNPDEPPGVRHSEEVSAVATLLRELSRDCLFQLSGDNMRGDSSKFDEGFFINSRNIVSIRVHTVSKEN